MKDRPQRQVLGDQVYEHLMAMVMDHEIDPGARLSIDGLARTLDVSPTPVREALARMESDGLVTKRSLIGYRATELLDADDLTDLFEMRLLLEPRAADLAAQHLVARDFDQLEAILVEMDSDPATGPSYSVYRRFAMLDKDFHDTIANAAGRPLLADGVRRLHAHLHLFRLNSAPGAGNTTVAEHRAILDALRGADSERATSAMTEHLRRSQERHRAALGCAGS